MERFLYWVVFTIHTDLIRVVRVFDTRQNPWRKLRSKG